MRTERDCNYVIGRDRVLVEIFFRSTICTWSFMKNMYRWVEDTYDMVAKLFVGLTNQDIMLHPIRQENLALYHTRRSKLFTEGTMGAIKRKRQQDENRSRKARSLKMEETQDDSM